MQGEPLSVAVAWGDVMLGAGAAGGVTLPVGRAGTAGPLVAVAAGIHGDEGPWGAWAIHLLLDSVPVERLTGRVVLLPVANPLAMQADARTAPLDHLDLNRCFPGNPRGSHTERLAALLAELVDGADLVVDLHGGGSWCVNAFVFEFPGSEAFSRAFSAPFIVDASTRGLGPVTLTNWARTRGAHVVAVEMGGRGRSEAAWARRTADGLERALVAAGVLKPREPGEVAPSSGRHVGPTHVMRPATGGILIPALSEDAVGTVVPRGTLLGTLVDPARWEVRERFEAPYDATALLLIRPRLAVLEAGAMTFVVSQA